MTKIRRLRWTDLSKIKKMVEYIQPQLKSRISTTRFTLFPFDLLHGILPLKWRFLQECFVALENKQITGMIAVKSDGKQKLRWKINRLIFDSNAYEIGKHLINFVLSKYGALGVETFIAVIDENYDEAINLFKTGCGFRDCSKINIKKLYLKNINIENIELPFREVVRADAKSLRDFDTDCMYPHFRVSLRKEKKDFRFGFRNKFINLIKGIKVKRLILKDNSRNAIESYVLINTSDNKNFWVDIAVSFAYQEKYQDILSDIINYIKSKSVNPTLYLYERKFYQSSNKLDELLKLMQFEKIEGYQVLVKDCWESQELNKSGKKSIMLFPDKTMPACNIITND